jgi:hypothetical protein
MASNQAVITYGSYYTFKAWNNPQQNPDPHKNFDVSAGDIDSATVEAIRTYLEGRSDVTDVEVSLTGPSTDIIPAP